MKNLQKQRKYNNTLQKTRKIYCQTLLGGKCIKCGSTDKLEFDHIVPKNKKFNIVTNLKGCIKKILIELKKCQLLCNKCHLIKSIKEKSVPHGGGLTGKRNCFCKLCIPLKRIYNRKAMRIFRSKRLSTNYYG